MEEKQFRMDFDAFLRSFKQSKNGSFAFLLGAGASITSGVQSAEDCIWDWKKLIYVTNNPTNDFLIYILTVAGKKFRHGLMSKEVIQ